MMEAHIDPDWSRQIYIRDETGVDDDEALHLVRTLDKRSASQDSAVMLGSVLGIIVGGVGGLELARLLGRVFPETSEFLDAFAFIAAAALGMITWYVGIIRRQTRELKRCLFAPACFDCGYTLRGLPVIWDGRVARVVCPECRAASPVALPEGPVVWGEGAGEQDAAGGKKLSGVAGEAGRIGG